MDAPMQMRPRAALTDYLAAERALLAWIRTGLALVLSWPASGSFCSNSRPRSEQVRHGLTDYRCGSAPH